MEIASKYQEIIREVIKNVSAEFTAEHVNGEVLKQLEKSWEHKLLQSGALSVNSGLKTAPIIPHRGDACSKSIDEDDNKLTTGTSELQEVGHAAPNPKDETGTKRKRETDKPAVPDLGQDEVISTDSEDDNLGKHSPFIDNRLSYFECRNGTCYFKFGA